MTEPALERDLAGAHAMAGAEVCAALGTDAARGLSGEVARARLRDAGPNRLPEPPRLTRRALLARQLASPLIGLLALAAVVSALTGDALDAAVIAAIVVVNGAIGYVQEGRAEAAALSLRELLSPSARIVRDGTVEAVEAADLVPGDIVALRAGDRVPADGRVVRETNLELDESSLTGESLPNFKRVEPPAADDAPLGDRATMTYAGTIVLRGTGRVAITGTGSRTEVGRAVALGASAAPPATPLQDRLAHLTGLLLRVVGALCVALATLAWLHGQELADALETGVALAVAAVPEGLPAVLTAALAVGVQRMARRNAIVRRLPAVETLGSTTVICTDKTGTLTEGRMRLGRVSVPGIGEREVGREQLAPAELELLGAAALASQQEPGRILAPDVATLAPTESAIAAAARDHGAAIEREDHVRVTRVAPFDSRRKRMSVVVESEDGLGTAYVKGAPESLLPRLIVGDAEREELAERAAGWAAEGVRVLLVARRSLAGEQDPESELMPLGLLGLTDPVRPEVAEAVADARRAGVRTILITGDHPGTAVAVARAAGILEDDSRAVITGPELDALDDRELEERVAALAVFARVAPEHKVRIVAALQRRGEVVAMTGDGVNDVPALEAAHIGVAMGLRGTDAAREAADIVLTDDDYSTIVAAIRRGRAIYDNVVRFVHFLLAANAGEILVFTLAIALGLPAPLTVVQILLVNLLTDGPPAVAMGVDPPRPGIMSRPPRPVSETILQPIARDLVIGGTAVGLAAFAAFLIGRADGIATAQTMAFATLVFAQLAHLFAVRADRWPPVVGRNVFLYAAVAGAAAIALVLLLVRPFHAPLDLVAIDAGQALAVAALSAVPFTVVLTAKTLRQRRAAAG